MKKAELRLFYTKKLKFDYIKNLDVYEEYEEREEEEEHRRVVKKFIQKRPLVRSSLIRDNQGLLGKVLRKASIRIFYELKLILEKWKNPVINAPKSTKMEKKTKKAVRTGKTSGKFVKTEGSKSSELINLVNNITSNSLLDYSNEKIPLLLGCPFPANNEKHDFSELIQKLALVSKQRKELIIRGLSLWQVQNSRNWAQQNKYFRGLLKLYQIIRKPFTKIISADPEFIETIEEVNYEENVTEKIIKKQYIEEEYNENFTEGHNTLYLDILNPLITKAMQFASAPRVGLLKWKNKYLNKEISGFPIDLESTFEKYQKALFTSIFKINKSRVSECFKTWHLKNKSSQNNLIKTKMDKFLSTLNKALSKNVKPCLQLPKETKTSDEILSNAVVALCKNLLWAKTKVFNTWARYMATKGVSRKIEEYLLRNLAKYPKMMLIYFFSK